jgi:peptidyl-dipeptidase A
MNAERHALRLISRVIVATAMLGAGVPGAAGPESVQEFIARAERELAQADEANQRAQWVNQTYITDDTSWLAARSNESFTALRMKFAREGARFEQAGLEPRDSRKLKRLTLGIRSPSPLDVDDAREWAESQTRMLSRFNHHSVTEGSQTFGSYGEVRRALEMTSDPETLIRIWRGWHAVGRELQPDYARYVELSRVGARALGFADVGELWRSAYDMTPQGMEADTERLWTEIKPLYTQLHCYARAKLASAYGRKVQPQRGPIRIELTRNPMGMYWVGAFDLIASDLPTPSYDLDKILESKGPSGRVMTGYADRFWSSMGFAPMPDSFWARSMFEKPRDRDVVCPGSAASIDGRDDVRMKICASPNALDFTTLHHELGHAVYARAYQDQPYLFRDSANDAFHEAVADLAAISITPGYLQSVGLIEARQAPGPEQDLGLLMRMALQRVTFMPFAFIVDKWRWQVFSGQVAPDRYDAAWWGLVARYQGLGAGSPRPEGSFDVAALPHITANVSYVRYFYAYLLEFQMLKAACDRAGWSGPLHRCSLYGDKANGARLQAMLALGASRPWPDALESFAGERRVSAQGMLSYFKPLQRYLERENRGRQCGW